MIGTEALEEGSHRPGTRGSEEGYELNAIAPQLLRGQASLEATLIRRDGLVDCGNVEKLWKLASSAARIKLTRPASSQKGQVPPSSVSLQRSLSAAPLGESLATSQSHKVTASPL